MANNWAGAWSANGFSQRRDASSSRANKSAANARVEKAGASIRHLLGVDLMDGIRERRTSVEPQQPAEVRERAARMGRVFVVVGCHHAAQHSLLPACHVGLAAATALERGG